MPAKYKTTAPVVKKGDKINFSDRIFEYTVISVSPDEPCLFFAQPTMLFREGSYNGIVLMDTQKIDGENIQHVPA